MQSFLSWDKIESGSHVFTHKTYIDIQCKVSTGYSHGLWILSGSLSFPAVCGLKYIKIRNITRHLQSSAIFQKVCNLHAQLFVLMHPAILHTVDCHRLPRTSALFCILRTVTDSRGLPRYSAYRGLSQTSALFCILRTVTDSRRLCAILHIVDCHRLPHYSAYCGLSQTAMDFCAILHTADCHRLPWTSALFCILRTATGCPW